MDELGNKILSAAEGRNWTVTDKYESSDECCVTVRTTTDVAIEYSSVSEVSDNQVNNVIIRSEPVSLNEDGYENAVNRLSSERMDLRPTAPQLAGETGLENEVVTEIVVVVCSEEIDSVNEILDFATSVSEEQERLQ